MIIHTPCGTSRYQSWETSQRSVHIAMTIFRATDCRMSPGSKHAHHTSAAMTVAPLTTATARDQLSVAAPPVSASRQQAISRNLLTL